MFFWKISLFLDKEIWRKYVSTSESANIIKKLITPAFEGMMNNLMQWNIEQQTASLQLCGWLNNCFALFKSGKFGEECLTTSTSFGKRPPFIDRLLIF